MSKNHLASEKSPYLLQHADNPVDWHPWGEAAFARAAKEDRPVFLSIGYSTCHWCHVMEHESFEDEEVAALLNDTFVCIKVDREERPDIDQIYMEVCQMTTGGGGWPLTIIMTPDKQPFFAATYIPKHARFGRTGMMELIPQIKDFWRSRRAEVNQVAGKLTEALQQSGGEASGDPVGEVELALAYNQMKSRYDELHGGFGGAPKFPTPHNLMFLLRSWKRTGAPKALEMVETTLHKMHQGGIYDHLGYGFHRYSTDDHWLVPHFEKMLYDQALLAIAYTETFQATGDIFYKKTAEEIFEYVLRDMTDPQGGFYSAEDADSEGEEGKFYVWSSEEIRSLLDEKDAALFIKVYGLQDGGNFNDEAAGTRTGSNILFMSQPLPALAAENGLTESELTSQLARVRQIVFKKREARIRPYKDDKILTDWNGLMIAALARAARVFGEPRYSAAAAKAAGFILGLRDKNARLLHRYRDGEAAITANLDDYAFFIWGLIELYEATFDTRHLETALELTEQQLAHFKDETQGGFFFTPDDGEQLLIRNKEVYDAAVPSGNSAAMLNLLRLAHLTARDDLEDAAAGIGRAFQHRISKVPLAHTFLLCAVDFAVGPSFEIVLVGEPGAEDTGQALAAVYEEFLPNKVVLFRPTRPGDPAITRIAPYTDPFSQLGREATVYICKNYSCEMPTADLARVRDLLGFTP